MPTTDRDGEYLAAVEATNGDVTAASHALGVPEASLRGHLRRKGLWAEVEAIRFRAKTGRPAMEDEGVSTAKDGAKVGVVQPDCPWSAEEVIRFYGDDPDECEILGKRGTFWGDPEKPNHHLRVNWISKADTIRPVDPNAWTPPPRPKKRKTTGPKKVVICGDHHCPYVDWTLHGLFLEWLADEKPDEGVILGDLLDLSGASRHRRGKKKAPADVNTELKAAFKVLRDYRHTSPDTHWTLLPGNHDDRIDHQQIDNAPAIYGVAPGGGVAFDGEEDETPALSMIRLLYLDRLGIDYVFEDFNRAKHLLGRKLTLRHGYLSGKNASDNMLKKITRSTVQGHTHRMRFIYKTEHDEHDVEQPTSTRLAAEAGCMAEIKDSLGYGDEEDWQQGFLVAHVWEDGDFTLLPVPYLPGRLVAPSGKRYVA